VSRNPARLLWQALLRFLDHNGPDRAAAVAYYTMLSLMPLLIFLISVGVAIFGSFDAAYRGVLLLFRGVVLPLSENSLQSLRAFVERAHRFQGPGLLLLAWTARRAFAALLSALEKVFEAKPRSFAHGNLLSFSFVLLSGIALLATLAVTLILAALEGVFEEVVGLPGVELVHGFAALFFTRILPVLIGAAFFFVVYRFFPTRSVGMTWAPALIGAGLATLLWEGAKAAFVYYLRTLARYAGLYGALEGVIVLALWLELSASIILYCGEVVALLLGPRQAEA